MTKLATADGPVPHQDARSAFSFAQRTLVLQRELLDHMGVGAGPSSPEAFLPGLSPSEPLKSEKAAFLLFNTIALALREINARQESINRIAGAEENLEAIALTTLSSTMHHLRTELYTAIGLLEEIVETTSGHADAMVRGNAMEAAKSLRLVTHYGDELNEIAAIRDLIGHLSETDFDPGEVVRDAMGDLARVSADRGVSLSIEYATDNMVCRADRRAALCIVRQLLFLAMITPGATRITCRLHPEEEDGKAVSVISITDNGAGLTLDQRAAVAGFSALVDGPGGAADQAGFAFARRMARALGGRVKLENLEGGWSTSHLVLPRGLA